MLSERNCTVELIYDRLCLLYYIEGKAMQCTARVDRAMHCPTLLFTAMACSFSSPHLYALPLTVATTQILRKTFLFKDAIIVSLLFPLFA